MHGVAFSRLSWFSAAASAPLSRREPTRFLCGSTGRLGASTHRSTSPPQKGWFKAAGLDVELEDGNGSVTTVQIVGQGRSTSAMRASHPMMIARDKGLPVQAIAVFARKSDIGLLVPQGSGITSPKELDGQEGDLYGRLAGSAVPRRVPRRRRPQARPARAAQRRGRGKDATYLGGTRRRRVFHRAVRPADRRGEPPVGCDPLRRLRARHAELRAVRDR